MRDIQRGGAETNNMMFLPSFDSDSIKYYKQTLQVSIHHFYITKEIGDVEPFLDMINVLKTAEPHDTIFISLNTPGGKLHTAVQIISAIRQSQATVITSLEGFVASAGTLIFLAGHKYIVNPNCTFMLHNYSHGPLGKGNEVALQVRHMEEYFKKLARDLYSNFLTPSEIEELINGKDFWMESEEVLARLNPEKNAAMVENGSAQVQIQIPVEGLQIETDIEVKEETPKTNKKAKPKAKAKASKKS